jgi:hypothetical protein
MAVAGSLESPQFLLSGKPATAVICQTMAENEPSTNHMPGIHVEGLQPGIHMNTPAGKGLKHDVTSKDAVVKARPSHWQQPHGGFSLAADAVGTCSVLAR